jgi:hypothetical protein
VAEEDSASAIEYREKAAALYARMNLTSYYEKLCEVDEAIEGLVKRKAAVAAGADAISDAYLFLKEPVSIEDAIEKRAEAAAWFLKYDCIDSSNLDELDLLDGSIDEAIHAKAARAEAAKNGAAEAQVEAEAAAKAAALAAFDKKKELSDLEEALLKLKDDIKTTEEDAAMAEAAAAEAAEAAAAVLVCPCFLCVVLTDRMVACEFNLCVSF